MHHRHIINFFDCVKSRRTPNSDIFSHVRNLTTCHLANIAMRLGRKLRWDATTQEIVGDDGYIDRKVLGSKVFGNDERMRALTTAIGDIAAEVERVIGGWRAELPVDRIAIMEAVNLIEAAYSQWCDATWLVGANAEVALPRPMELNGLTEEDARRRIEPMNCISWIIAHVANQYRSFFVDWPAGRQPDPRYAGYGFGTPATQPPLEEALALWRDACRDSEPWLHAADEAALRELPAASTRLRENMGSLLVRCISHTWVHIGEISSIRQVLGHRPPQFVDMHGWQYPGTETS